MPFDPEKEIGNDNFNRLPPEKQEQFRGYLVTCMKNIRTAIESTIGDVETTMGREATINFLISLLATLLSTSERKLKSILADTMTPEDAMDVWEHIQDTIRRQINEG